jgi:spore photoproduct lyase
MVSNTERVIGGEERGTASLDARLKAAARCAAQGYPLAFHFDPIVIDDGCEAEYRRTVERLFAVIAPRHIVWISLGALRFMPDLKTVVQSRFPQSKIVYGEFIAGLDGKMRYQPLRMKMYCAIAAVRACADVCPYFCMEDDDVADALIARPTAVPGTDVDEVAVQWNQRGVRRAD